MIAINANTPPPAHLPKFKHWAVANDGKAPGTAGIYSRQLSRCARFYGTRIDETTVRTDADVQRIVDDVSKVVLKRGRWTKGTLNIYDVRRNLVFALQSYSRFSRAVFPKATSVRPGRKRTVRTSSTARRSPRLAFVVRGIAIDLPTDELPKRLRSEIARVVRKSRLAEQVKQAYKQTCQLCGTRLELARGTYYSEGHHLKPLGEPHNGPDSTDNLLCVCPNCHAKLDFAAITIDTTKLNLVPSHSIKQEFVDYHNALCKTAAKPR